MSNDVVLVSFLLTLHVVIANYTELEQVNADWVEPFKKVFLKIAVL